MTKTKLTKNKILAILTVSVLVTGLLYAAQDSAFASAGKKKLDTKLDGSQEVPAVVTDTTGKAKFKVNKDMTEIKYKLEVKDGVGILGAAGAHIHCASAGSNGPVILFLAGSIPGGLDGKVKVEGTLTDTNILDISCGATISEIVTSMQNGHTYVNVHSTANPGGEVRGQI